MGLVIVKEQMPRQLQCQASHCIFPEQIQELVASPICLIEGAQQIDLKVTSNILQRQQVSSVKSTNQPRQEINTKKLFNIKFYFFIDFIILAIYVGSFKSILKSRQMSGFEDYFGADEFQSQPQDQYIPPDFTDASNFTTVQTTFNNQPQEFNFHSYSSTQQATGYSQQQNDDNEFNQFEEDETAKRIRQEQERIQNLLKQKSEREWHEKQSRKAEGRKQLEEFYAKKQQQKNDRSQENLRKQGINKDEIAKLNIEAGWRKVITNINVRQGQHKGKKDINRMRQSILHRRQDDKR